MIPTQALRKQCFYILGVFILGLFLIELMVPVAVIAEPLYTLEIEGDGVNNPLSLSMAELQAMEQYQHVYSTINTWPSKKWYIGEGVKLGDLLKMAGIKENARLVRFVSIDGYEVMLTVKELLEDKRYYFPHLKDNSENDGSIPGSPSDALEVEAILAILSAEDSTEPLDMNDMNALLLIIGQRAVTEQTNNVFLKYINKIEVMTTEPPKWDNPRASIGSGDVSAGTEIELSNKSNDADKIYYTTDGSTPTINSPIFNWSARRWWNQRAGSLEEINKAIEIKEGTVIKAITIGPGKADSDVVTFTYRIGDPNEMMNGNNMPLEPPGEIKLDRDTIDMNVGSSFELGVITGPHKAGEAGLIWTSSDTRVATVDNYGLVTVVGPGTATITVKTEAGDLSASCAVNGSKRELHEQSAASVASQEDSSEQALAETVSPKAEQESLPEKEEETAESAIIEEKQEALNIQKEDDSKWQYLEKKELAAGSLTGNNSSGQADTQFTHIYEMSLDLAPLPFKAERNLLEIITALIVLILFLSGAGKKYREYLREVVN